MNTVIPSPAQPSIPVAGRSERFPVRRVFCIGRNYADHAKEMGASVDTANPMFFTKPADALVTDGADVPYPSVTHDLHHEVEMVVALGSGGTDLTLEQAAATVWGYGVGLDLTRRDLQAQAKAKGSPWDVAKAFDHSAPVSALVPASEVTPTAATRISLEINGETRQAATLGDMLLDVPAILSALSKLFELKAGDIVYTGTPAGVSALLRGDRFRATLEGVATLEGRVV
ncbi:MAG: fumarylacetoacetate hydrolase family protein [Luteibacter sp.]|uniref:fumarylacetoacetate hydrolase family protein n=1 Tax=Rhodanobacteraceae TaxID=1775411 RepID=UPI00056C7395|nr:MULTISPECIES: fumarylacetoacetate hydrolase family protein [Rhodanobacteraceae]MDQ7994576.1 fumarylacetoacetate hydrolase family protein [Luteibacter sp.]MDQ8048174.1 fumarylacetoacetate hydrolase family protein [Luteibacter sp.]SDG03430.1 fumarylpyruvate hydrolase [Dyella sp. 333MFSha]SKB30201.1 fumarylpyruvate hydrolase [Luteibacter sp. 22Crub2.1]